MTETTKKTKTKRPDDQIPAYELEQIVERAIGRALGRLRSAGARERVLRNFQERVKEEIAEDPTSGLG